jgi:circadian clock protein KaiC
MSQNKAPIKLSKARTGIPGLDEITGGGLPRGTGTLVEGGAGSGKTVFALQSLVNGARAFNEPGIFVAFEENSKNLLANASTFGWNIPSLQSKKLFFFDAQLPFDLVQSGSFDLTGMLAILDSKVRRMGARRIVFDAIDVVLNLLNDPATQRRELLRLYNWLQLHGLTSIITSKANHVSLSAESPESFGFMQFMVDCSINLRHGIVEGVSQRNLRIVKYRGSSFEENTAPFVISNTGFQVAATRPLECDHAPVTSERISSGVERLDTMLGGGFYRGAGILITGFPGTAKSTLAGAFAEAACKRGEHTLFVSFDSDSSEVIRNLDSVNIHLKRFIKSGFLRMVSARAIAGSGKIHLMHIRNQARDHQARCVVIDPVSALAKAGNEATAHSVAERLIDWSKAEGLTLLCTSLLDDLSPSSEGTPIQISTIADTWIHLNYLVKGGERNRGLSIIKSRGTSHSNQVRELILSGSGVTLADAYTASGEVLTGTLRWEKEIAQRKEEAEMAMAATKKALKINIELAELESKIMLLQRELAAKRTESELQTELDARWEVDSVRSRKKIHELRSGDGQN